MSNEAAFTIDDIINARNKVLEYRRDQVLDILNGFSSEDKVKREDITLDSVVIVSSELADEYPYLKDIPFIYVTYRQK